jgi:hypothetical protein
MRNEAGVARNAEGVRLCKRGTMRQNVRKMCNEAGYTRKIGEEFAI